MDDLFVKAATVIAVALAGFSSFPGTAQQQETPAQQQSSPMQQTPSGGANTNSQQRTGVSQPPSPAAADLRPVRGELVTQLDSKSAKQGDSVVVKTEENVTFPGGAQIPKGSKLVGHVTNVQPRGDGKENSQIAIQFDRAEMNNGQNMAIESVIQSVAPAGGDQINGNGSPMSGSVAGPTANGAAGSEESRPGSNASPSLNPNGSTQELPQGTQGTAQGTSQGTMTNNRSGVGSDSTAQPGETGQNTNAAVAAPGSIVARNGNVAIRTTSVPGVLLANNIDGLPFTNASGIVLGARRDIHLDDGTQMVLAVAAAPQGAGGGMNR